MSEMHDVLWQHHSEWARAEATRRHAQDPLPRPWEPGYGVRYFSYLEKLQQTYFELLTGAPQPALETVGGWLPHHSRHEVSAHVARAIWQVQSCPAEPLTSESALHR
jgi:hypothetical protein